MDILSINHIVIDVDKGNSYQSRFQVQKHAAEIPTCAETEGAKLAVGVVHAEKKSMNEYLVRGRVGWGRTVFFFLGKLVWCAKKYITHTSSTNR